MTDDRNKPDLSCVTMITLYNVKNVSEKSGFGKKETIGKEKRKAERGERENSVDAFLASESSLYCYSVTYQENVFYF